MIIRNNFGYGPNLVEVNHAKVMPLIEAIRKIAKHLSDRVIIIRGLLIHCINRLMYYNSITNVFLPNFYACSVECVAYSSGVRLQF
jgi:hypothetical protein